jgi:cyclase
VEKRNVIFLLTLPMMDNLNDMHYGSNSFAFQKAEELRIRMTNAEIILWEALRNKKLSGLKFRRQHPIGRFIVDFYCHKYKLVVELDGGIHEVQEVKANDQNREEELKDFGLNILRFTNEQVINELAYVLQTIKQQVDRME